MSTSRPRLYDLLPAYARYRDAYEGEPLRTLMDTLELPFGVILEDLDALYRGWFIETCEDWQVPYIGDLVGVRGLESARQPLPSHRTGVANALAYRRSKGTPAAVERAAADATGWACHAVDYRRALAVTASFLDPSGGAAGGTADLRRMGDLDRLGGPFNALSHSADLRPSDPANPSLGDRGGFHLLNLGLAFWRLQSFPVSGGTPREVIEGAGYTFHPFGLDVPLLNPPQTAVPSVFASTERQLPVPLRRAALAADVEALRRGEADSFFSGEPAFRILVGEAGEAGFQPIPPAALEICDLADWTAPAGADGPARIAVDPVRGRFLLPPGEPGRRVRVDYSYGLSMDLGGGPYPRQPSPEAADLAVPAWRAVVAQDCTPRFDAAEKVHYFTTLSAAIQAWSLGRPLPIPPPGRTVVSPRSGAILICDSGTYEAGLQVNVKGRWLAIQAAEGCCPALRGDLEAVGSPARMLEAAEPVPDSLVPRAGEGPAESAFRQGQLVLGGLWIEGGVRVLGGASLVLEHCTVAPVIPGRTATAVRFVAEEERLETIAGVHAAERTVVRAVRCILGGLDLGARPVDLELVDCLVDGGGGRAVDGSHAAARLVRCTFFGEVHLSRLSSAASVLFERRVRVAVPSEGTIRFSYVPSGSRTPPQERCIGGGARAREPDGGSAAPVFTARSFGDPAYAQLSPDASFELRHGGEDGSEIGVYNSLRQSDRLASLATVLDELLPWGMNARIFFAT
jgi:Phage tail protein (Tail_P2_I)